MSGFTARDCAVAAVATALLLVANAIAVPLTLGIPIPGIRHAVSAPIAGLVLAVALMRLRRPGALLLVQAPLALLYLAIHPIISAFVLAGCLIAELVCWIVWRGYPRSGAWHAAPAVYQLASLAAATLLAWLFAPRMVVTATAWAWAGMVAAIVLLSLAGSWAGVRLGRELIRAGRLRVPEDACGASTP